jgi:hypothetical protein
MKYIGPATRLDSTQPRGLGWCSSLQKTGLDSAQPRGLGWCSSPPKKQKNHDWLLCMSTVTSELISFFLHAERAQCTFCKQEDD